MESVNLPLYYYVFFFHKYVLRVKRYNIIKDMYSKFKTVFWDKSFIEVSDTPHIILSKAPDKHV